jgi:thiamine biosynthesis protein ThiI
MNRKMEKVSEMLEENFKKKSDIEVVYKVQENEILIDVREEKEKNKKLKNENILEIPFFRINSEFSKLDQSKNYLFYCEK